MCVFDDESILHITDWSTSFPLLWILSALLVSVKAATY